MLVPGILIPLSNALHRMSDNGYFCLFPLKALDGQWRLHCLFMLPLQKMVRIHHRRPVRGGMSDVSPACARARFVLSVCHKYETTFPAKRTRRKLGGSTTAAQWMEAEQILQQRQGWIRNTSPTKKKSRSGSPRKRDHEMTGRTVRSAMVLRLKRLLREIMCQRKILPMTEVRAPSRFSQPLG